MPSENTTLSTLLAGALPFLRASPHLIDPDYPRMIAAITAAGAGECWHKDNTFLGHLIGVHRILKLWGATDSIARCGLLHSVYSNSYVDLIIFDPANGGRDLLRSIAGDEAEKLVHLFCVVPRQSLVHDDLLFRYSEEELAEHLEESAAAIRRARDEGLRDESERWRVKMAAVVPCDGIKVKDINTGEVVALSRRMVAAFLLLTMADFSDQLYSFQDELFDNIDGKMDFSGNTFTALWPGDGRPGLWMNSVSRMGALHTLILREEELYSQSPKAIFAAGTQLRDHQPGNRDEWLELVSPPVFKSCTKLLGREEQREARDLYWQSMTAPANKDMAAAEKLLKKCLEKNGYVAEPHLVLGQVYMAQGRFEEAEEEASQGLRLLLEWGCPWDKRISWEGWVSWGRLILQKAKERSWPKTSFGIIGLGLIRS